MLGFNLNFNEFAWLAICVVMLFYVYDWYQRPKGFPPGPKGIPLLGVLPFLGKYPERTMSKWSKTYGPIMSVRMGTRDWVVLNDFKSINQALVKQHSSFSGRPKMEVFDMLNKGLGIITVNYGEFWKAQRKFCLQTLRGFGVGRKSMERRVVEEGSYLCEAIREEGGRPFNILNLLYKAMANNICHVILGKRFDYNDRRFENILHGLVKTFSNPVSTLIFTFLMFSSSITAKIPPFPYLMNELTTGFKDSKEFISEIIKDHQKTFDDQNIRDVIDAFLSEIKKKSDDSFTEEQLQYLLNDLLFAGTETSATTIYWALLVFLHFPEAQEKLREETFRVVGQSGDVSMSHRASMPYARALINEIFRFRTIAPLSLVHMTTDDVMLEKNYILKGTMVLANLWSVHNDVSFWGDPHTFRPERFLDQEESAASRLIPFSVGPRVCLGEQLAKTEVFILLVTMVQKFRFIPDGSKLPDIENESNGNLFVPSQYTLIAQEL